MPPDQRALDDACHALSASAETTRRDGPWQSGAFETLAGHGVLAAFIPLHCGGTAAPEPEILRMLVQISRTCLTTALALTQWASAARIIAAGPDEVRRRYLPAMAIGEMYATVGISQLSTSRRHLAAPVLSAVHEPEGWRLSGLCPWVTGGDSSGLIVTGATVVYGDDVVPPTLFFVVDTRAEGLHVEPPMELLALGGTRTSAVRFDSVVPLHAIEFKTGKGPKSGGLATTALAIGSAANAIDVLEGLSREGDGRPELVRAVDELRTECDSLEAGMLEAAHHAADAEIRDRLRTDATSLAVRAAQAALVAAKGAGFVVGHPAERAVREAMFFLVWSCPQTVASAVICELAGLDA